MASFCQMALRLMTEVYEGKKTVTVAFLFGQSYGQSFDRIYTCLIIGAITIMSCACAALRSATGASYTPFMRYTFSCAARVVTYTQLLGK